MTTEMKPVAASFFRDHVKSKGSGLPSRIILHGVEKIGKTSWAAHAPGVIIGMARGETGLESLIDAKQLPETPHFGEWQVWQDVLDAIDNLRTEEHAYKTLVLDTLNGVERLCHEHVCARDYGNVWGKKGFANYMQGYEVALADWRELLVALDNLRAERKMAVVALVHSKIQGFRNPEGADYDRYQPDMHYKTWGLTHKWADAILFANYYTEIIDDGARPRGIGGQLRSIYTQRHAAYDAGNRLGLPEEIDMGSSGKEAWDNFISAVKQARKGGE